MKELGLYRTSKVNYVPYTTDGNGRDRYIVVNRGGLFPTTQINPDNIRRTGTTLHTKVSYKSVSPYVKSPNFHYHSDGLGRDSYIYSNGGGLIYDSKPLNSYKLIDFLRTNDDNLFVNNEKEQIRSSKNRDKYQKFLRAKEKDIINRLYETEKKKSLKNEKKEGNKNIQVETDEMKFPKLSDKKDFNTLENKIEHQINEDNKNGELSSLENRKNKNNSFLKNKNHLDIEKLFLSLSKINDFNETKQHKKINKPFNQAYLHLRNNNNYSNA